MLVPLLQGMESPAKIEKIISLTQIRSESVINALTAHLVQGMAESMACLAHDVPIQNFRRALRRLNERNTQLER